MEPINSFLYPGLFVQTWQVDRRTSSRSYTFKMSPISLPTSHLIFMWIGGGFSSIVSETWVSVSVDTAKLQTRTDVRKEVFSTNNLVQCLGIGQTLDWAYLACFWESTCTVWEAFAIAAGNVTRSPNLGPSTCKTLLRPFGELCFAVYPIESQENVR